MRRQEVLNLGWDDINFISGSVFIKVAKGRIPRTTFVGKKALTALIEYPQPEGSGWG
jgi:integrase